MADYTSEHTGVEIDLAVENANLMLLTGAADPATSTVGTLGQIYQNTTDGTLFRCTNIAGETYTWTEWADYSLAEKAKVTNATTTTTYTTTLDTTWSGTEAPYTKEQTVTGILSTDNPIVDIVLSGTYATDSKIEADWAEIYRIVTSANSVTLYAHKKPTNSIPLQFKVVR